MKIFIDQKVHKEIEHFYDIALQKHEALDEMTVLKKINRLYEALESLSIFAYIYPFARLKKEWIQEGYREFICEDFHFAYKIYKLENGTEIVRIHDAVHSLLYI